MDEEIYGISGFYLDTINRLTTSLNDEANVDAVKTSVGQTIQPAFQINPYGEEIDGAMAKCLCLGIDFPQRLAASRRLTFPQQHSNAAKQLPRITAVAFRK
jgi:hypothetical protein